MIALATGLSVGLATVGICWVIAWSVAKLAEAERDETWRDGWSDQWPYAPEVFPLHSDEGISQ